MAPPSFVLTLLILSGITFVLAAKHAIFAAMGLSGAIFLFLLFVLTKQDVKLLVGSDKPASEITHGIINDKNPAYVISLTPKDYTEAVDEFDKVGIYNVRKFDAVKGTSLTQWAQSTQNMTPRGLKSALIDTVRATDEDLGSLNASGCYLSHVTLWQKVVNENLEGMFIFESDARCIAGAISPEVMQEFRNTSNPHLLSFGIILLSYPSILRPELFSHIARVPDRYMLAHAYYITRSGAELLLKRAFPIEQQVDAYISCITELGNVKDSGYEPINHFYVPSFPCIQLDHISGIQTKEVAYAPSASFNPFSPLLASPGIDTTFI